MKPKTKITYCQFSEDQINESGLLSPERMAEVSAGIDARITPCCDSKGAAIKNAFVTDCGAKGRFVFARCDSAHTVEYMRRTVLPAVLTEAELGLINETCLSGHSSAKDAENFAKAKKVDAWDGGAFYEDTYFSSMDELCDHVESEDEEWPKYVWAAKPRIVIGEISVADVVEGPICDNGWEDMETSDLNGVAELQTALDKFTEANSTVVAYHPDYKTAILLAAWKEA